MADTVVAAQLTLDSGQADKSVKSFKTQLREAEDALIDIKKQFGDLSPEAIKAAKNVASLRDQFKDAKEVSDLFDPGKKFAAFGNVARTAAGSVTALTGSMALFGDQSKDVEQALLKVQGALALSEGANTIADSAKDFKRLNVLIQQSAAFQKANAIANRLAAGAMRLFGVATTQTSTAFKVLKGAIIATGIGALVVLIGTLISKISDWTSGTKDAEKAQEALNNSLERQQELLASELKSIDVVTRARTARAKIAGKSEQEITAIEDAAAQERIDALKKNYERLNDIARDSENRSVEDQKKANDSANEAYRRYLDSLTEADLKTVERQAKIADDARKKQDEASKKAIEQRKADAQKRRDVELQAIDELEKLKEENYLKSINDARERDIAEIDIQFENEKKRIEGLKLAGDLEAKILDELGIQRLGKITDIDKKIADDRAARERDAQNRLKAIREENILAEIDDENERAAAKAEIDFNNTAAEIESLQVSEQTKTELLAQAIITRQQVLDEIESKRREAQDELQLELDQKELDQFALKNAQLDMWYQERLKIAGDNEQLIFELTESYEKQKTALQREQAELRLQAISSTLGKAAEVVGKQTAAGKALAIAAATIDTYLSAIAAFRGMVTTFPGPVGIAAGIIAAGVSVAAGLKSIREIAKAKVPGAGGGSVPSSASISPSAPLAPQPQVQTTQLDQRSLDQQGSATVRAFVVESDVTNGQERITRLNRQARLGGG